MKLAALLRRKLFWTPVAGVVLVAAWWFAWMSPESAKLSSARQQQTSDQATLVSLQARVLQLRAVAKKEHQARQLIRTFDLAVPPQPDAPTLVVQIYRLATAQGLQLDSITDNAVNGASGYSTIPLNLTVSGGRPGITRFVNGLYDLRRLVTVQQLQVTGPSNGDVVSGRGGAYHATIAATAYTSSLGASSTAGTASTASAPAGG